VTQWGGARHGENCVTAADVTRYGTLGEAFRTAICSDNDRYFRSFEQLRRTQTEGVLVEPNRLGGTYPAFEICAGENDVTLNEKDYKRNCIVYDLSQLFTKDDQAELNDGAWRGLVKLVLATWSVAEAAAIHPEELNAMTGCAKKTLWNLRKWTYLRATGHNPPPPDTERGTLGPPGNPTDMEWAAAEFDDF
jgi:hypothetical protein